MLCGGIFQRISAQSDSTLLDRTYEVVKEFSRVDTNYVEPQRFNFQLMLWGKHTYESYTLYNDDGQSIVFSPKPSIKVGPYFGWRFLVLGYTFDISHASSDGKKELDLSLYSNKVGVDFYYRETGSNYRIRDVYAAEHTTLPTLHNANFDGFDASIKGLDVYYIVNHRRFSYPAAFSQSTVQRRSAGSPMFGLGYTRHSIDIDWQRLADIMTQRSGPQYAELMDSTLSFSKVKYTDVSFSGGYGYNWVFARNWLFASSLSIAVAYKHATSDVQRERFRLRDFSFSNFNLDGVARFGLVWNNTRWFAGASAIFHSYNYRKEKFATNTVFGSLNLYVGFNFDRR